MGVSEGTFWESIGPGRREGGRAGGKASEAGGHSRFSDVDIRRRSVDPEFLVVIHGVYRAVPRWCYAAEFGLCVTTCCAVR